VSAAAVPKLYSFEEFCEVIEDGQKADLIDGEIFLASPDSTLNYDIQGFLEELLRRYSRKRCPGKIYGSRVAFRLERRGGPEPDLAFVSEANAYRIRPGYVDGPPDLAIEVVSEDSVARDYVRKRAQYERAGVPEYWIVDPLRREVLCLRLAGEEFVEEPISGGVARSVAVPGFWIEAAWLFRKPLPDPDRCIERILAGDPES
jgi:Uma2 family endonuclease